MNPPPPSLELLQQLLSLVAVVEFSLELLTVLISSAAVFSTHHVVSQVKSRL